MSQPRWSKNLENSKCEAISGAMSHWKNPTKKWFNSWPFYIRSWEVTNNLWMVTQTSFFCAPCWFSEVFSSFLLFLAGSMFWSDLFFRTHMTHGYPLKVEAFQSFWSPPTLRWALAVHWQCTVGSCGTKNADTYPLISPPKKEECQGFFFARIFFSFFSFFLKEECQHKNQNEWLPKKTLLFFAWMGVFFFLFGWIFFMSVCNF